MGANQHRQRFHEGLGLQEAYLQRLFVLATSPASKGVEISRVVFVRELPMLRLQQLLWSTRRAILHHKRWQQAVSMIPRS